MKIEFRTFPIPERLHGWRRTLRRVNNVFRGILVVDFGRVTLELAN